jgi:hypothetical protein
LIVQRNALLNEKCHGEGRGLVGVNHELLVEVEKGLVEIKNDHK